MTDSSYNQWTLNGLPTEQARTFSGIWGNFPLPSSSKQRRLAKLSSPLAKLRWLSRELYSRRMDMLIAGRFTFAEFSKASTEDMEALRAAIAEESNVERVQNDLLYDCGPRGSLEIRLLKSFRRSKTRLSFTDKNYEAEVDDLEALLRFGEKATTWDRDAFLAAFTAENIAILGFSPLLRAMLSRYSNHVAYFPEKNRSTSQKYAFYVRANQAWRPALALYDLCEAMREILSGLTRDFRNLLREKLEFTCVQVPVDQKDFDSWFERVFGNETRSSREFVNLFEAVWLFTECVENTLEPQAFQFIRKEAAAVLSKSLPSGNVGMIQEVESPARYGDVERGGDEIELLKMGEASFRSVFHPNASREELRTTALLFARKWREYERRAKIRKTAVRIKRWD
jgi:hypothetical protein